MLAAPRLLAAIADRRACLLPAFILLFSFAANVPGSTCGGRSSPFRRRPPVFITRNELLMTLSMRLEGSGIKSHLRRKRRHSEAPRHRRPPPIRALLPVSSPSASGEPPVLFLRCFRGVTHAYLGRRPHLGGLFPPPRRLVASCQRRETDQSAAENSPHQIGGITGANSSFVEQKLQENQMCGSTPPPR